MTCSGVPLKRLRSTGSWVATPTGQVLRWHTRIMMQPAAISGAVEKPNSSAPSSAPTTTSRPVRMPPSTCTVVRPPRDQAESGGRVAHLCADLVDLVPGELAAFAGLGSLRHLDLHHVGVDEIFRRHAEAAGGDLLDRRAHGIAVRQRLEAVGFLAPFTGVGFAADAVHGDGERGMRFARNRAERHGTGGEATPDALPRRALVDV